MSGSGGKRYSILGVAGLVLLLVLATALRVIGLGDESFWFDEGYTVAFVSMPFTKMLAYMPTHEPHPPLYFIIVNIWSCLGVSELLLRLPSAIFGVLTVLVLWRCVREQWGIAPAFAAAALCATSGICIWYSQEARMYSLVLLLAAISMRYFLRFVSPLDLSRKRDAAWLTAANAALLYTHNLAVLVPVAQWIVMCPWAAAQWHIPDRWARVKRWTAAQAILAGVAVPWIYLLILQRGYVQSGFWIPRPTLGLVVDHLRYLLVFESQEITALMLTPLAVLCVLTCVSMRRDARVWATVTCGVVPVIACYCYSRVYTPIMIPRVILYVTIPIFILMGLSIYCGGFDSSPAVYRRGRQLLGTVCVAGLIVCNLLGWYRERTRVSKDEFRRAARIASTMIDKGTAIVFPNAGSQPPFDYYFDKYPFHERVAEIPLPMHYRDIPPGKRNLELPVTRESASPVHEVRREGSFELPVTRESIAWLAERLGGKKRTLVVMNHARGTDPRGMVKSYFDTQWVLEEKIDLVEITLLIYTHCLPPSPLPPPPDGVHP